MQSLQYENLQTRIADAWRAPSHCAHAELSEKAGHGLGLLSVRTIAEKYHGLCRFEADGQIFYASVMLDKAE